ncbi:uncharacterized protein LOC132281718 [Cornus florida]|uniref:uncharacterized protein LOC132281718 n=1 Tax=Cornus florida TaxID=4283 RepID=UPI00289D0228|nr:uncharacterized protein LOC132281718 [Cornus florida]
MGKTRASNLEPRILRLFELGDARNMQIAYNKDTNEILFLTPIEDDQPEEEEEIQQEQVRRKRTSSTSEDEDMQQEEAHQRCTNSDDEDVEFQLALFYSIASSQEPEIQNEKKKGVMRPCSITYGDFRTFSPETEEKGDSSHTVCVICNEVQPSILSKRCSHGYCRECFGFYIVKKIQGTSTGIVRCPVNKCKTLFEEKHWRQLIPKEVLERWENAALEASVLASPEYILCPFKDCWEVFVDDGKGFVIRACPKCWRLFCARCNAPWHERMSCSLFRLLRKSPKLRRLLLEEAEEMKKYI